jgi:hypothetical protein
VLVYGATGNIGDTIQTIALSQLLPQAAGIYRHDCRKAEQAEKLFVVNGFLSGSPPAHDANCLFAGVNAGPEPAVYKNWFKQSPYPVGARDPWTNKSLLWGGLKSEMVGCATLTFPRYEGPRAGVYSVDTAGPGRKLTHAWCSSDLCRSWEHALDLLSYYQTAAAVYTSRLHVAIPCLAFGTPVCVTSPTARSPLSTRFTLLTHMGVEIGKLTVLDISSFAAAYISFLSRHLGQAIVPGQPKMPVASSHAGPDASPFITRNQKIAHLRGLRHVKKEG